MSKYDEMLAALDPVALKKQIVQWIREWFEGNGKGCNAIVGISGGKDSSVVAALCVEALGRECVIGVLMPNGEQADISDSYALVNHLGIDYIVADIKSAFDGVVSCLTDVFVAQPGGKKTVEAFRMSNQAIINLAPRIRMSTLYAVSQSYNGRVANTCNLSEDWVGYSTRYGDSVGDFSPLSSLTTDEVIAVGLACGLPEVLVKKTPSDGLCGKSDEDNLGFTYRQLNEYIRTGVYDDASVKETIDRKHEQNLFKLRLMPSFVPDYKGIYRKPN